MKKTPASPSNAANKPESRPLRVRYDESKALYASQALVQASLEEITIDFSSGIMQDPANAGVAIMPIHTRIAMSKPAAQRLLSALTKSLEKQPPQAS
jgi:hypothetical protein